MPNSLMTKHNALTEEEMSGFSMSPRIYRFIEHFREKMNLDKSDMNVLD